MLEQFFTSKVRIKILKLFLLSKERRFHVRDITRQIEEEINAVRRELGRLYKIKVLGRESRGNKLYYFWKEDFIFYPELFRMIIKEFGLGGELRRKVKELGEPKYIFVTYELFEEEKTEDHNLDLLIVGDGVKMSLLQEIVHRYEIDLQREINYSVLSKFDFKEMKERKNPFLRKFFEQEVLVLVGERTKLK